MISFTPGYFGWLGNQMFEYAATKALSLHLDVPCLFPRNRPDLHELFPNLYAQDGRSARFSWPQNGRLYQEPHFHFDSGFWDLPDWTVLSGYFQSERYFREYAEVIRREFAFAVPTSQPRDAVSIHVRRGDYLSFPDHHPPCSADYYREAMSRFPGARFLVFSDDPGWCLLNLKPLGDVDIVTGQTAIEDMAAMSRCKAHIIANSTFSWWGAWLDPNPDKKVIAPAKWFGPAKAGWDTRDLIPEGWVRI